jgi:plastocyanin
MQKRIRSVAAVLAFFAATIMSAPTVAEAQSNAPQAFVSFGVEDAAGAANNRLVPDEVFITVGGRVAFQIFGLHQPTIYRVDPSTTRDDIASDIVVGANYVIADAAAVSIINTARRDAEHAATIHDHLTNPSGFVLQATNPFDASNTVLNRDETLNIEVLFKQPGKYLVFCAVKGHLDDQMFGFVNVN